MQFDKKPLSIPEQIALLEKRGMTFADKDAAAHYLSTISYYRLSAYWFTFLEDPRTDHVFKKGTQFEQALDTYIFDRKLRLLIFDEIERIEIALRSQIIYRFSLAFGSHWFEKADLFRQEDEATEFNNLLKEEIGKSKETFIEHYKRKYATPEVPPAWMSLELASFGQLSVLYKNLKNTDPRKVIADYFRLHENLLSSWLESLAYVRNVCAHHSRLWNRKLPKPPMIPSKPVDTWLSVVPEREKQNRVYITLGIVRYLLGSVNPGTSFSAKLKQLLSEHPTLPLHYMGFPEGWQDDKFWNR